MCTQATHDQNRFPDEQPTQPIPYESLAEVAAAWREQQREKEQPNVR